MNTKTQIHNLIILDESGSMSSIKETIISGFNEIVQSVKGIQTKFPDQDHFISLISFNSMGQKVIHFMDPVSKLEAIDGSKYQPDAMTPLFDAMGFGLNKLKAALADQQNYNVLVTILTDGMENSSKEYDSKAIKALVEELKALKWTFTYIGTEHDVDSFADSLSIENKMNFVKSEAGLHGMFSEEMEAREEWSRKIKDKEDFTKGFYKK